MEADRPAAQTDGEGMPTEREWLEGLPNDPARVDLTISGRVESLHLDPGDRVLVTLDPQQNLGMAQYETLIEELKERFAPHEVILLNGLRVTKETA